MEKILTKLLKQSEYQSKLLAEISMNLEPPKQNNEAKKAMMDSVELLKEQLTDNSAIKNNPVMEKLIKVC